MTRALLFGPFFFCTGADDDGVMYRTITDYLTVSDHAPVYAGFDLYLHSTDPVTQLPPEVCVWLWLRVCPHRLGCAATAVVRVLWDSH